MLFYSRLQSHVKKHNLVVASYEVVRNDIDFFGKLTWNYVILDEGHVIKNSKTKLARAVKQLTCNHRLILSGEKGHLSLTDARTWLDIEIHYLMWDVITHPCRNFDGGKTL